MTPPNEEEIAEWLGSPSDYEPLSVYDEPAVEAGWISDDPPEPRSHTLMRELHVDEILKAEDD
jgi:hypothetical protein